MHCQLSFQKGKDEGVEEEGSQVGVWNFGILKKHTFLLQYPKFSFRRPKIKKLAALIYLFIYLYNLHDSLEYTLSSLDHHKEHQVNEPLVLRLL